MTCVKQLALAALTALALVAGGVVCLAEVQASPQSFLTSDASSSAVANDADRSGKATPILF